MMALQFRLLSNNFGLRQIVSHLHTKTTTKNSVTDLTAVNSTCKNVPLQKPLCSKAFEHISGKRNCPGEIDVLEHRNLRIATSSFVTVLSDFHRTWTPPPRDQTRYGTPENQISVSCYGITNKSGRISLQRSSGYKKITIYCSAAPETHLTPIFTSLDLLHSTFSRGWRQGLEIKSSRLGIRKSSLRTLSSLSHTHMDGYSCWQSVTHCCTTEEVLHWIEGTLVWPGNTCMRLCKPLQSRLRWVAW